MTTIAQLLQYMLASGNDIRTAGTLATELGESEAHIQVLLDEGITADPAMFVFDGVAYTAVPPVAPSDAQDDSDALAALEAVICSVNNCANDVDVVLTGSGVTADEWLRGNANIEAILAMHRCGNLRDKLIASGLDAAKLDGMLDSCDKAVSVNTAMSEHLGAAGV